MGKALTARQREIYEYIRDRVREGVPPTVRQIGEANGIRSPNGVCCHLRVLAKKGWIAWSKCHSRTIRLLKDGFIPRAGEVRNGKFTASAEDVCPLDLREWRGGSAAVVEDDYLEKKHIIKGDLVVFAGDGSQWLWRKVA